MIRREPDIAASVRQRLLNKARASGRPFNELLQYFATERFLYRLSKSAHADKFVLKVALMFTVWQAPETRPTMDIDLLGITGNSIDAITAIAQTICEQDVEPDGLVSIRAASRRRVLWGVPIMPVCASDFVAHSVPPASPCNWILVSAMSLHPSLKRWNIRRFWISLLRL